MNRKLFVALLALFFLTFSLKAQTWSGSTPGNIYYNSGFVGIGTPSPNASLHLYTPSGTGSTTLKIEANGAPAWGGYYMTRTDNLDGTGHLNYYEGYGSGDITWAANNGSTKGMTLVYGLDAKLNLFNTSSVSQIQLATNGPSYFNGGNVGLGTNSVGARLTVSADNGSSLSGAATIADLSGNFSGDRTRLTIGNLNTGTTSSAILFYGYNAANTALENKWEIGTDLSSNHGRDMYFYNANIGAPQLFLQGNGSIGANSSAPISSFQVDDYSTKTSIGSAAEKGSAALFYGTGYMGFNAARFDDGVSSTQSWQIDSDGAHNGGSAVWGTIFGDLYFAPVASAAAGTVPQILTDADMPGRVALKIGHDGIVYAKQIKVQSGIFPDYVFGKNYRLKPLSEVATYIDRNHHLPEVPAAAGVEKDGIDLAEMNKLLLKKVEELTLYVIRQDKRIEKLEKPKNSKKLKK